MQPEQTLGLRVGLGFAALLALMFVIVALGLVRLGHLDDQVARIVNHTNVKTALANDMILALRDRAISMHTMAALDSFERYEELDYFNELGSRYRNAREKLDAFTLSEEERDILTRVKALTLSTQPIVEQAVTAAQDGDKVTSLSARTQAIPAQKQIAAELDRFLELQQEQTRTVLRAAARSYEVTRTLMISLGIAALMLGIGIALTVIRNATRQAHLLQHQALFDGLTGLPNRTLFGDRLRQAALIGRRDHQTFAVLALDLDGFKDINDSFGHHVGDNLLQAFGREVVSRLRDSDTVARMGGDEFAILLPKAAASGGALAVAKKIQRALEQPILVNGRRLHTAVSIGIALFPEHGDDGDTLLRRADVAMYTAKRARTGFEMYRADLDQHAHDQATLHNDLRRALAAGELVLHYQPKIDFASEHVTGVEALARWQHPERGLLYPDEFIPFAERNGLIKGLTIAVLRIALQQCRAWLDSGLRLAVAVNISAINVQDPEFPAQVEVLLAELNVPCDLLELEVTETAVMTEPTRAVECLQKLRELGLQISIDDFGTGYSSMAYLKELLVAKIKIDKSFVMDMMVNHHDAVIVRSTVELGHNLGLKVVAEGVENERTWDQLKSLGCDSAQGYYMSRPMGASDLAVWLKEAPWSVASAPSK